MERPEIAYIFDSFPFRVILSQFSYVHPSVSVVVMHDNSKGVTNFTSKFSCDNVYFNYSSIKIEDVLCQVTSTGNDKLLKFCT